MANVVRKYRVPELQCGGSDQEIAQSDPDASGLKAAVDPAGAERYGRGDRFHGDLV